MTWIRVVGIRFKEGGKVYDFDAQDFVLKLGDFCLVETEKGKVIGEVKKPVRQVPAEKIERQLKKVIRVAVEEDMIHLKQNQELEEKAKKFCMEKAREKDLPIKLVEVEISFDNSKATFYFTADGRIDFRELVKDLAHEFKTRIEMRQVGARDEAKMFGGLGCCGRVLCCASFIKNFEPVSIKMAKAQNLPLNPTKISGRCGRLMCCLTFEYETYELLRKYFPREGSVIQVKDGKGKVRQLNVLKGSAVVELGDGKEVEVPFDEIGGGTTGV